MTGSSSNAVPSLQPFSYTPVQVFVGRPALTLTVGLRFLDALPAAPIRKKAKSPECRSGACVFLGFQRSAGMTKPLLR
jgi:hypothetical protein